MSKNKSRKLQMENQASIPSNGEFYIREKFQLTEKQKQVLASGLDTKNVKCLILDGCAGVSKTYLAVLIALKLLNLKKISHITYIRTLIQARDSETGFLSGDLEHKTEPFNEPFCDKLEELLTKPDLNKLLSEDKLLTKPASMLRGTTFDNCCTILDENQNALLSTIETVMTRMGEHSLLILCGDSSGSQNDLGAKTGFKKVCELFDDEESRQNGIFYFKFNIDDIVRSKLVKFVVKKFQGLQH